MAIELGVAYLSILPETSKISSGVVRAMGAAGKSGGKAFTGGVDTSLGGMAKSFGAAGKNAGEALAKSALSAAKSDIAKLTKTVSGATDAQATALGKLRVAQAKLSEVQGSAKPKASALAAAEEAVANAQRKATATSETAKAATDKLTAANGRAKTAAEQVAKAQASAAQSGAGTGNRFTRAFKSAFSVNPGQAIKVDGSAEGSAAGKRFATGFKSSLGTVMAAGGGLVAAMGIGKLLTSSLGLEATFSQTMNTMAAVANVPADQIKTLSALAIKMGADTTFSASEASGAMLELAKGGLSAATIASGGLQGTLTLAAAGGTDLATASTIASNALNTFGLKGKDMASVAAALAGGANASTASVESLGNALSQVGPGAKTAGLSLQETVAALSAFDAAGIKGNDAGTSLKTMLTRLVPQTDKAKGAMEDLGLKFTDATGAFVPITNVAQQLQDKLGKLSAEQKTSALATLFGSDATRAATVLMNLGSKGLTTYIKATQDQGAAEKVAAARMSGTAGAWESFKGSVETAKLQLGLFLAPAAQAGLKLLTTGVNNIAPAAKSLAAEFKERAVPRLKEFAGVVRSDILPRLKEFGGFIKVEILPRLKDLAGFITGTVVPTVGNLIVAFTPLAQDIGKAVVKVFQDLLPVLRAVGSFIVNTAAPAFKDFTGFLKDHGDAVAVIATLIATVFIPHWVALGVAATVSAVKQSAAWVATQVGAVKSAAVHSAQVVLMVAGWVLIGVQATINAVKVVAAWVVTQAAAIAARVVQGVAVVAVVAGWVLMGVQALLNAARIAAAWLIALGPVGWVILALVAVGAAFVVLWTKSQTFRTIVTAAFNGFKWIVVSVIQVVWNVVSGFFGNLLEGAARAFGWVPGLGPKLKAAAKWFGEFRDSVNAKLDGLKDRVVNVEIKYTSTGVNLTTPSRVGGMANGGLIPGMATGGLIPGTPSTKDNMIATAPFGPMGVASGEFLVNSRATAQNLPALEAINSGKGAPAAQPNVSLTVNYPLPEKVSVALPHLLRSAANQLVPTS